MTLRRKISVAIVLLVLLILFVVLQRCQQTPAGPPVGSQLEPPVTASGQKQAFLTVSNLHAISASQAKVTIGNTLSQPLTLHTITVWAGGKGTPCSDTPTALMAVGEERTYTLVCSSRLDSGAAYMVEVDTSDGTHLAASWAQ
ncbi:MAG: hypothetical protein V7711_05940 [Pseudomonadales bacterium]